MSRAAHAAAPSARPLQVWWFADGKPGHDNQAKGLLDALAERRAVDVHRLAPLRAPRALWAWSAGRWPHAAALPDPDLHVGAGHGTHLSLLAARRARGGRAVVVMRPSLPLGWFDLCLIPRHDEPPTRNNVITTRGALNTVRPSQGHRPERGLMLVGGPSRHWPWSDERVIEQACAVAECESDVHWRLTTSRRTPEGFVEALAARAPANVAVVPVAETGPRWVAGELAAAGKVWVTPDSVSMVYEALTAGAAVGVFELPRAGRGRVAAGLERLRNEGWITGYSDWRAGQGLTPPRRVLDEAGRCAEAIIERWFDH